MNKFDVLLSASAFFFILLPACGKEIAATLDSNEDRYTFDPQLFRGSRFSQDSLTRLAAPRSIVPGNYKMDVYTNNKLTGTYNVYFKGFADGTSQPCLSPEVLESAHIKNAQSPDSSSTEDNCVLIQEAAPGGTSRTNLPQLRLDLSVPQNQIRIQPRGYVDPHELDDGASMAFINYLTNYYNVSYSEPTTPNQRSLWMSLSGGMNLGSWQYRQLSNFTWDNQNGNRWNNIRSYVQHPLPGLNSQLMFGQLITKGRFFSGLNYRGASIATDERMLPDSMRGYAPVIRGVATTNARVSVMQNGTEIYQTTVAPGPFEITDLYPTSFSGDLDVSVTEANGSVSRFSVPFSAVPESMRPGISRFNLEMGKTQDNGDDSFFSDVTWQHGLTNAITFNTATRIADGYQALMLGGVYASAFGAIGADLTWSHARLPDTGYTDGWMSQLRWSKTFQPTNTTVSMAGYRYSTRGYHDLMDVLGAREAQRNNQLWVSDSWRQQSRFELTMNQSLADFGNVFISSSTQNYRGGKSRDTQLQLGYSNSFRYGISINLSVGRQHTGGYQNAGDMQTFTSLSLSFPLGGSGPRVPSLSNSWMHSTDGSDQYQSSLSGMLDTGQTTSYNLDVMRDQQYHQTTLSGGVQKRFSQATVGVSASRGNDYWQAAGNVQGAVVAHSGGITFGPYLGDTFALVEAKGAAGAKVFNSEHLEINDSGYALLPAITPYRYNRITLDPQDMQGDVELLDNEKQIAPIAGASAKVIFRTRNGKALLIKATRPDGSAPPAGADVLDDNNTLIGIAGQNGQIYLRTDRPKGRLTLRWGNEPQDRCYLSYDFSGKETASPLIRLNAICQ
jgi:outer membrane usher protein